MTAGADDSGRPAGAEAGSPAVVAPDAGGSGDVADIEWDGDGPAPRPFITTNANNSIGGSLCVGFDCVANEAFGFDTLRLKENNLRIHFNDTSVIAGFPTRDWRIVVNSSASGGGDFFAVNDADAGFDAFRIDGDSLANALTIDAQGDVGLGLRPAALDLHIRRGDTPSIRLEQDGSSGFTPQTFDIAANESNFFIRDATSGSTLPLRIRPGSSSNSVDIHPSGLVGIKSSNPQQEIHIRDGGDANNFATFRLEQPGGATPSTWDVRTTDQGSLALTKSGTGILEMAILANGNVEVAGTLSTGCVPAPCDNTVADLVGDLERALAENEALRAELAELRRLVEGLIAAQN